MLAFYHKILTKDKPKKVALIAVMRKLLVLAFGVLKSGKPFDINY
jgi:transposase